MSTRDRSLSPGAPAVKRQRRRAAGRIRMAPAVAGDSKADGPETSGDCRSMTEFPASAFRRSWQGLPRFDPSSQGLDPGIQQRTNQKVKVETRFYNCFSDDMSICFRRISVSRCASVPGYSGVSTSTACGIGRQRGPRGKRSADAFRRVNWGRASARHSPHMPGRRPQTALLFG